MEDKNRFIKILKRHKLADFSKITAEGVNRFFLSLRSGTQAGAELQKHYAQDTMRKIACDLKSFLNYAIRQDAFSEAQLKKLSFPKIGVKVREAVYTDEQWEAIQKLASKDKDFLLYLKALYYTGCRPSEIVSLHRKDIDTQGNARIFQNKVKTKKTVSIPPFLLKDMGEAYIFKGHGRQPEYYGKKFRKLRLKLGLSTEYSLYTFRHTFGTRLLNKTGDIHLVSKALGHSS